MSVKKEEESLVQKVERLEKDNARLREENQRLCREVRELNEDYDGLIGAMRMRNNQTGG